ncbi:thrombomodulin-like [Gouania willdenowi]|uniref:Thrombomodulin n=1 Tax=Gouania willdenowi TaxID=441366 RepID=A0A8C5DK55_GOUWI|nr:thrombomodulin-like [Gouania willdenowi]
MLSVLLLLLLLFLNLGAAGPAGTGLCAGLVCSFRLSEDFNGARDTCRGLGGELFPLDPEGGTDLGLEPGLVGGGRYWVSSSRDGPGGGSEGLCVSRGSVGGLSVTPEPRTHTLDGFVCRYRAEDVCGRLLVHGGSRVNYTSALGFQMLDEKMFPPGTTAVTRSPGSAEPDSKHLCFSTWVRAPWSCEVMDGGCEHGCTSTPPQCSCSPGHQLHPNGFSCSEAPCADCALHCARGYERAHDGRSCVDVDECDTGDACTAEGEECVNTEGGYKCTCADGFDEEDGACVNVSICNLCEHMECTRGDNGVYQCACRSGFRVSPSDPTKCDQHCTQRDCPSRCVPPTGPPHQCFCPHGYVTDTRVNVTICTDINECDMEQPCDHVCENLWGGFRCSCRAGFELRGDYRCVRVKEEEEEEEGSGSALLSTLSTPQAASLPPYIKTGSVLGVTVFLAVGAALLYLLWRHAHRRCGRFELSSFKHPDLDIYYLHQVTTDTYKRLSFDKQSRTDPQTL